MIWTQVGTNPAAISSLIVSVGHGTVRGLVNLSCTSPELRLTTIRTDSSAPKARCAPNRHSRHLPTGALLAAPGGHSIDVDDLARRPTCPCPPDELAWRRSCHAGWPTSTRITTRWPAASGKAKISASHSPLAERRVYREKALRIQHEDARHEHEDTISEGTFASIRSRNLRNSIDRW